MRIVFATNNAHKLSEIRSILGAEFQVLSLADIGCHADIPETNSHMSRLLIIYNMHRHSWL